MAKYSLETVKGNDEDGPITSAYKRQYSGVNGLPNRKVAAQLSAMGGVLDFFTKSNPVLTGFTLPLSSYDFYYDAKDMYNAIKNKSGRTKAAVHLGLDYPFRLSQITNMPVIGKFDDWIPIAGVTDDLINGITGKDLEDLIKRKNEKGSW